MCSKKTILICPLNWGLGHATRMIPLINHALANNFEVLIASDGDALALLKNHYPLLTCIELPSLNIRYGKGIWAPVIFLFSIPQILRWIKRDNKALQTIVNQHQVDVIVSDNRWGLWNKKVTSIFVTHQIMVKMPRPLVFLEKPVFHVQQWVLRHFDELWIPDFADQNLNLSGDLSHKYKPKKPTKYIGILSQFTPLQSTVEYKYDVAVILSGPEPHRSILEQRLIAVLKQSSLKTIIVGGKIGSSTMVSYPYITYIPFANTETLQQIFATSNYIICRSGYTSIMDLMQLGKTALLIPTPSQTEQEYLAEYLSQKAWFISVKQNEINSMVEKSLEMVLGKPLTDINIVKVSQELLQAAFATIKRE